MKVIGTLASNEIDSQGSITFYFDSRSAIKLQRLEEGEEYLLTIESKKAVRTHRQNSYLWALIGEMCRNPNAPRHDEWELYCWLLEQAKSKFIFVQVPEDAVERLRKSVRALEVLRYTKGPKGNLAVCRVFEGSSKMSKKEMIVLIDKTLEVAEELGIDTTLYKEVLK